MTRQERGNEYLRKFKVNVGENKGEAQLMSGRDDWRKDSMQWKLKLYASEKLFMLFWGSSLTLQLLLAQISSDGKCNRVVERVFNETRMWKWVFRQRGVDSSIETEMERTVFVKCSWWLKNFVTQKYCGCVHFEQNKSLLNFRYSFFSNLMWNCN